MDRLTVFVDGNWIEDHSKDKKKGFKNGNRACMTRLAEYENTDLLPSEIEQMRRDYIHLRKLWCDIK